MLAGALAAAVASACGGPAPVEAGTSAGGGSAPQGYRAHDASGGRSYFVLPPGENGLVNAAQFAANSSTGARPPGSDDQLQMYDSLIYGSPALTDDQLGRYFLDESFGVRGQDVTRVERPDRQVTIVRDRHEIPHVSGSNLDSMALGAGYAAGEDRLFFMDVLRHYAEGDVASFLGPSCSYEQMDHDQLLVAGYTNSQLQQQLDLLPQRFGAQGRETASMIKSYVAGVNQYIAEARHDPSKMPVEYAATPSGPQPWSATDVVAITSLITTQATGGGSEVKNAATLRYLQGELGGDAGKAAFADFKEQDDPDAPTTITDRSFPYMTPARSDPSLTAVPDDPGAPLSGGPSGTTPGCTGGSATGAAASSTTLGAVPPGGPLLGRDVQAKVAAVLGTLTGWTGAHSNAVVVDAKHSRDGHPIAVFGPELGYYAPEVLMVEDLHAPGFDAEGAAFPGTSMVVQLGRGRSYAWSATTASTDQIDQRIEKLCQPGGARPAAFGTHYLFGSKCLAMSDHSFDETLPGASGSQPGGSSLDHDIHSTLHGIVQGWTTVGGAPVAVVDQRSTFMHDVDSLVGFLRWGQWGLSSTPDGWMAGADDIPYSFNWFYINSQDIAYDVSGRDPVRHAGVDPNLPTWGTGGAEWQGMLSPGAHPHEVDPQQGYFTSWNNKPAPNFSASDDTYSWGPVFRSQMLDANLRAELAQSRRVDRAQVVQVAEKAATMDLSAFTLVAKLGSYLGPTTDPEASALLAQLEPWAADGAHRRKASPSDQQYADASAVAIWDEAYPRIIEALFGPIFSAGGVRTYDGLPSGFDAVQMGFENTPNDQGAHDGDGYYGGWNGYVLKAVDQLASRPLRQPFSPGIMSHLCGNEGPAGCRHAMQVALDDAYKAMVTANSGNDVPAWTQNTATVAAGQQAGASAGTSSGAPVTMPQYDEIRFQAVGAIGQPAIDWQNRPTFQQVAEFPA